MNFISYDGTLEEMFNSPEGRECDVVVDAAAHYGPDAPFAITYLLKNEDKLHPKGFYAEPFYHPPVAIETGDGMIKSYYELLRSLDVSGRGDLNDIVFRGSRYFLPNDCKPIESDAALHLSALANDYDKDYPLYIIALGPITNIASALMLNPTMKDKCVLLWQGGDSYDWDHLNDENMLFDIEAARVVLSSGMPVVLFPSLGVIDHFTISKVEINHYLVGRNASLDRICDRLLTEYLVNYHPYWSINLRGVPLVAWLLGEKEEYMRYKLRYVRLPSSEGKYEPKPLNQLIGYVYQIKNDVLMNDFIKKLTR